MTTSKKLLAKFTFCTLNAIAAIDVNAAESLKSIEKKKQELLMIEQRLDAKMHAIEEKLQQLDSKTEKATPPIAKTVLPETLPEIKVENEKKSDKSSASVSYGSKGFEFKTDDNKFSMAIQSRLQFRYANPFDGDPRSLANLEQDQSSLMVR
ncbi:MAG: hypothetical protein WBI40_00250, partial [Methylococcaceae bacterium]